MLALAATLAIVLPDHAALRAAPQSKRRRARRPSGKAMCWRSAASAPAICRSTTIGASAADTCDARPRRLVSLGETAAPELLAVLRFLRDEPGIARRSASATAPPICRPYRTGAHGRAARCHRCNGRATGRSGLGGQWPAQRPRRPAGGDRAVRRPHAQLRARWPERLCYDGELYPPRPHTARATAEERAHAALGLTRADCIDPRLGPMPRASLDEQRKAILDVIADRDLSATDSQPAACAARCGPGHPSPSSRRAVSAPSGEAADRAHDRAAPGASGGSGRGSPLRVCRCGRARGRDTLGRLDAERPNRAAHSDCDAGRTGADLCLTRAGDGATSMRLRSLAAAPMESFGWRRPSRSHRARASCSQCSHWRAGVSFGFFIDMRARGASMCFHRHSRTRMKAMSSLPDSYRITDASWSCAK